MNDEFLIKNDSVSDSWLGIDTASDLALNNPFMQYGKELFFKENPYLLPPYLLRQPDFLAYAAWVLFEVKLLPFQAVILAELWQRPFPMLVGSRGLSKTYLMALYAMLKCLFYPDYKVVLVGAAFRQSKLIFEYCEKLWADSPVYKSLLTTDSRPYKNIDKFIFRLNSSSITAIPIGIGGAKIRGLRANAIIADEFDSHDIDIFERVIAGFGVVAHSPADNVIKHMKHQALIDMGADIIDALDERSNQIIISGTAGYFFGPLYNYYKRYEAIVNSRGDREKLTAILGDEPPEGFCWQDYSVIRIPYQLLPPGFLDKKIVQRAKATMNSTIFSMEYEAIFVEDSDGFFKRSVIEGAVASEKNIGTANWVNWCPTVFEPLQRGNPQGRYVYGIDPASEHDNLAIAVLEVHPEHARLVHMWTTNKEDFKNRHKKGFTKEVGYNAFVARKVRELMSIFPCVKIGMDMQGGGLALMEALHDPKHLKDGEEPLWEEVDFDKPKDSDLFSGSHIVEAIQFARYEWLHEANFGLVKDLETRKLLLPRFDPVSLTLAEIHDKERVTSFEKAKPGKTLVVPDTLEDLFMEIEDLKDELASIVVGVAGAGVSGRMHWKVPEVLLVGNKKGRGRKDRYSALLIANSIARRIYKESPKTDVHHVLGGLIQDIPKAKGTFYSGPEWWTKSMNQIHS